MAPKLTWLMKKPFLLVAVLLLLLFLELSDHRSCTERWRRLDVDTVGSSLDVILTSTTLSDADNKTAYREAWLDKRKSFLRKETSRKVLFFSYMRGGSTIGGEVFNQNQDAFLWYEPVDAFYIFYYGIPEENLPQHDLYYANGTRRSLSGDERESLSKFLKDELTCNLRQLPAEATAHHFLLHSNAFTNYTACVGPHIGKGDVLMDCVRQIAPICGRSVETSLAEKCHVLVKLTREVFGEYPESFRIGDRPVPRDLLDALVSRLLQKMASTRWRFDPRLWSKPSWFVRHRLCLDRVRIVNEHCLRDLAERCRQRGIQALEVNRMHMADTEPLIESVPDLHVFYYVRDPRAIAVSRTKTEHMVIDIADYSPLKEARHVCHKMAVDLSDFRVLQKRYPGAYRLLKYEDLVLDPAGFAARVYGTINRRTPPAWSAFTHNVVPGSGDPRLVLNKWKSQVSDKDLTEMNRYCEPLLSALNYEI